MAYLMAVPLDDGDERTAVFEVSQDELPAGLELAAWEAERVAPRAAVSLEHALQGMMPALRKVVHALDHLSPHSTEVEFGLKLGGETGVIFAKGTAEVNFTVRMSWQRRDS